MCPTEVTEVLCRVIPVVNTPGMVLCVPYRQNENESSDTVMNVVQNSQTLPERVGLYRTHIIPGYG